MILDVREDTRDWLVVTETDPRCLLLREWLQFELDNSVKAPEPDKKPEVQRRTGPVPLSNGASTDTSALASPMRPAVSAPETKSGDEPGEFTKFFKTSSGTGLPPRSNATERTSRTVQRPNTPMPVAPPIPPPAKREEGEFTKIFGRAPMEHTPAPAVTPGAHQSADDFDNLFASKNELGMPAPASPPAQGEFTRMFGAASSAPPPMRPQSALGERASTGLDDPLATSGSQSRAVPTVAPTNSTPALGGSSAGPSEYTKVITGQPAPAGAGPTPSGGASASAPMSLPGMAVPSALPHVAPPPPPQVPPAAGPGVSGMSVPAAPPMKAPPPMMAPSPAPANRNLIIFLSVLAVLAVVLILLVFFALRK